VRTVRRSRWYRAENGEQRAYPTPEGSLLYVRPAPHDGRLWEWGTRADGYCHVFGYKVSQANAKLMAEHRVGEIGER
jgi:hypothetical protein